MRTRLTGSPSAVPASVFLTVPDAGLFSFEGVDVEEPQFLSGDHQRIAIDHLGYA